ncbi:MAG TPA: phosphoserine phosphatase SerB [Succinivibrio sp.]|nr:phosphoserine phosphatase SerB [Succinivibrio sp.]
MSLIYIVKKDANFNVDEAIAKVSETTGLTLTKINSGSLNAHIAVLCKTDAANAHELCKQAVLDHKFDFDVFASNSFPTLKEKGEICLDMDMTSVQIEGIDEIARRLNVFDKVSEITSKAMHGGLDFAQSLTLRVSMLKDGSASVIEDVKKIMRETDGLDVLMQTVSKASWVKGICSGGFEQLICVLEKKYNLDMVCANSLEIVDGKLTGKVDKRIVDAEVKKEGVRKLQQEHNIKDSQIIVLGDGANDLKMIEVAALGIAYHAKPLVQKTAPFSINYSDLTAVALLLELNS